MENITTSRKMTILLVDDNTGVRRLLRRVIAELEATVVECSDGAFALAAYTDNHPDIVLMDIHMPLLDGLAATRHIRRHDPSAKVVIVTDYGDDQLRTAASEAGACAYVVKQNLTHLAELIRSVGQQPC
jgi:CheY-like chemotaxis protein